MSAVPKLLDTERREARVTEFRTTGPTRTEAAYRAATTAHERVKQLDAELHQTFQALDHATERMREEGAGVTVQMSAPLAAAWSTWKLGNETPTEVGDRRKADGRG